MKANEAPEKIYIQSFNVSEEAAKFDKSKMFFDDVWTEEPELEKENIEYTRTDAFIEKACEWLKEHFLFDEAGYCKTNIYSTESMIYNFKNTLGG